MMLQSRLNFVDQVLNAQKNENYSDDFLADTTR